MNAAPISMEPLENLARFQGIPAFERIKNEFLPAVGNASWQSLIEEFLDLQTPRTPYAHPFFPPMDFATCPGSGAHHAHIGGLALHILQGLENARALAAAHQARGLPVRVGLLYAAILLHDAMKRFVFRFNGRFVLEKSEDGFIGKREDHHSWMLRELAARGAGKELIFAVAAMHGIDDVSVDAGVRPLGVVNHYLSLSGTGFLMTADDVRPEHVLGFLADSGWPFSGRAQARCQALAQSLAPLTGLPCSYLWVYLGSRFGFEGLDALLEEHGLEKTALMLAKRA